MAKQDSPDIQFDSVGKTACPKCGSVVDVSAVKAFAAVQCAGCGAQFATPGKLDHFILLKALGKGQMGMTFRGYEKSLGRYVAIKVMRKSLTADRKLVDDFLAEGRAMASLGHPNVVRIYSLGQDPKQPYIVMELIPGGSLERLMAKSEGQRLEESRALSTAIAVAKALGAACEVGLIHGDVKPANIMLDEKGAAKLVDFGMARFGGGQIGDQDAVGTPYYLSPEQVRRESIDHRTDIYSLGATLYHALAGAPPFVGESARQVLDARLKGPAPDLLDVRPSLNRATANVVARMLETDPGERYDTYEDLVRDLWKAHGAAGGIPTTDLAEPDRPVAAPSDQATPAVAVADEPAKMAAVIDWIRRRWYVPAGSAAAVVLAIVLAIVLWPSGNGQVGGGPDHGGGTSPAVGYVKPPVFNPPGCKLIEPLNIELYCETRHSQVRYTTDGTVPTEDSPLADGPILIPPGTTVKAMAFHPKLQPSKLVEAVYARDPIQLSDLVALRAKAEVQWDGVSGIDGRHGLKTKITEANKLHEYAEELYRQKMYKEAKEKYDKLVALCGEVSKLHSARQEASSARGEADTAIGAIPDEKARKDAGSAWNVSAKQASEAFEKGSFADAKRLWESARDAAGQQHAELARKAREAYEAAAKEYDLEKLKAAGTSTWTELAKALAQARQAEKDKQFGRVAKWYDQARDLLAAARDAAEFAKIDEKVNAAMAAARKLLDDNRLDEAIKAADEVVAIRPSYLAAWRLKNMVLGRKLASIRVRRDRGEVRPIELVRIPAGEFVIGTPPLRATEKARAAYEAAHKVTISKPFYMSVHEITKKQFWGFVDKQGGGYKTAAQRVGKANGWDDGKKTWALVNGIHWNNPGFHQDDRHPVVCVTWQEAHKFCQWASEQTGAKVRLPTEAEWEYACRAGTRTLFSFGDDPNKLAEHCNYADESFSRRYPGNDGQKFTARVGELKPNPWGLHDMHGNVLEWCADWFVLRLPRNPQTDPTGPEKGLNRVVRGGGWGSPPASCRSDKRTGLRPSVPNAAVGFRVVVTDLPDTAFEKEKWHALPPVPPIPNVHVSDLEPIKAVNGQGKPQTNRSQRGGELKVQGTFYEKGMGVYARSELTYANKSEYKRFVAVVGVAQEVSKEDKTSFVCEVYADKRLLARSPLLRNKTVDHWHFNVAVPPSAKQIRLVVTDGGRDRNQGDMANWCNAGFVTGG